MEGQIAETSMDTRGRILRPKKKLNDAEIATMLNEMDGFDDLDLDLSDEDDITDKTYEPLTAPEYDECDPEESIALDESEPSYQASKSSGERILVG